MRNKIAKFLENIQEVAREKKKKTPIWLQNSGEIDL